MKPKRVTDAFIMEQAAWAYRSKNPLLLAAAMQLLEERLEEKGVASKWVS